MACSTRRPRRAKRTKRRGPKRRRRRRRVKRLIFGGGGGQGGSGGVGVGGGESSSSSSSSSTTLLKKMNNFKKQVPLLQVLKELKPDQRTIILGHLDANGCCAITSCIREVIRNKKLPKKTKNKLRKVLGPQKDILRQLISAQKLSKKKELLPSVGGSLTLLISTAIPILLEIARAKKWI